MVWGGIIGVSCVHHDATPHRNDVLGKIRDKGDVAGAEVVHPKHLVKIRARKGGDLAAGTDEVSSNGVLVDALMHIEVNVAGGSRAGLWGDSKDDGDVAWEGAAERRRSVEAFPWTDRRMEVECGE